METLKVPFIDNIIKSLPFAQYATEEAIAKALQQAHKRISEIHLMAHLGYWELNIATSDIYWSNTIYDIFGLPSESQASLESIKNHISQKDFQKIQYSIQECSENGKEFHIFFKISRPIDGKPRWVECHGKANSVHNPSFIYGTILDVSKNIFNERQMENIRGLMHVTRNISHLILHIQKRDKLLENICQEITSLHNVKGAWIVLKKSDNQYLWYSHGFKQECHEKIQKGVSDGILPSCYEEEKQSVILYNKDTSKCNNCIINQSLSIRTNFSVSLWYEGKHYGRMGIATRTNEEDEPYINEMFIHLSKEIGLCLRRLEFIENANSLEKLHTSMFQSALSGFFIHDLDGNLIDINPATEKIHKATKEEILQCNISDFYPDGHQEIAKKNFDNLMKNGFVHIKTPLVTAKGKEFYAEIFSSLIELDGKKLVQGTINDITSTYNNDKKMRQHEAISISTSEGICITNSLVEIEYVNESFTAITGYTFDEVKGKNPSILKSGNHRKEFYKQMWQDIDNNGVWQGEIWNRKKSGQVYPEYITIRKVEDSIGRLEGYVAVFSDLSNKKTDQRKIDFLNTHDPLTKLPNRQNIKEKLDHLIKNSNLENNLILVISLDIDNFKNINDSFGHSTGDRLLVAFVKRMQSLKNYRSSIGRLSADEFVLFQKIDSFEQCVCKLQSLLDELQKPFEIDNKQIGVTVSMGTSIAPDDATSADVLIKNADTAMHKVKQDGKNNYIFFKDDMTKRSYERILMVNALRLAIDNEDFNLYYQPLQDLDSDKIIGFEALIRWQSNDFGMVSPDKFIPLAEETKLILPIGEWVIKEACKQLSLWSNNSFYISINISGVQLYHSNILDILKKHIGYYKIDANRLKLEITESTMMNLTNSISDTLDKVKQMGISLCIDDFGTGYSSLSRLKKLPVDTLKVDKSFTVDIPQDSDACILSKSILSIAKQMNLNIVVEGIETKPQKDFYKNEKGCILQGYYLAKPMPIDKLEKFLQTNSIGTL